MCGWLWLYSISWNILSLIKQVDHAVHKHSDAGARPAAWRIVSGAEAERVLSRVANRVPDALDDSWG